MCSNIGKCIYLMTVTPRKIQKMSIWRFPLMDFRLLDTPYCTEINRKDPKKIGIDQEHTQLRLRVRALTHLLGPLLKPSDLKN